MRSGKGLYPFPCPALIHGTQISQIFSISFVLKPKHTFPNKDGKFSDPPEYKVPDVEIQQNLQRQRCKLLALQDRRRDKLYERMEREKERKKERERERERENVCVSGN